MKKRALFLSLLSLAFIAGCGENSFEGQEDKNTPEAKQFDISQALDTGDYATVLNDPNASATDYAAAAMGEAGLDPVSLIQAMNEVSRCAQTPTPSDCTTTTTDDLGTVTNLPLDPAALDELQTAKDKLATELAANPTDPDLNFQMTLTSLTSTLTALAQVGQTNSGSITGGFDPTDGISTTEATNLATYITNNITQFSDPTVKQVDTNGDGTADTSLVDLLAGDVANVVTTLPDAGLGAGSDLNTVLNDATNTNTGLNYGCATDASGNCLTTDTVTATDISNYLNCVLGSGISGQGGCL